MMLQCEGHYGRVSDWQLFVILTVTVLYTIAKNEDDGQGIINGFIGDSSVAK
ncbi:MAG: hypothetical protein JSV11_01840 [Nitrospiraceae bacterium]|nr:MAG: hypothetical protein JSV11_01840 [Nitrospiraceae bacterium]